MRLRIISILIVTLLAGSLPGLTPARVAAQGQPELSTLKVSLWPEYDRQSMLVIYRAILSTNTTMPVNMIFRIPLSAQPFVLAVGPAPESVGEVSYSQKVTGEWKEISFPATFPAIQFEYYDNSLLIDDQARHFEYLWPGDYKVQVMTIEVQKPWGAKDVKITPNMGEARLSDDSLEYYSTQVGALSAAQVYKVTLDYMKATSELTMEQLPVKASQPTSAVSPVKDWLGNVLIWVAVALGVALIVGGGWWYWRSGRKEDRPEKKKRSRGLRPPVMEAAPAGGAIYCHQCGKRAASGDRFCRSCGTRLRTEI